MNEWKNHTRYFAIFWEILLHNFDSIFFPLPKTFYLDWWKTFNTQLQTFAEVSIKMLHEKNASSIQLHLYDWLAPFRIRRVSRMCIFLYRRKNQVSWRCNSTDNSWGRFHQMKLISQLKPARSLKMNSKCDKDKMKRLLSFSVRQARQWASVDHTKKKTLKKSLKILSLYHEITWTIVHRP